MDTSGTTLEPYLWLIILATWLVLLLLGIAGGDPLAAGRPGHEALAVAGVRWLRRTVARRGQPRRPAPQRATESGLHALA